MKEDTSQAEMPVPYQEDKSGVAAIILQGLMPVGLLTIIAVAELLLLWCIRFLLDPARYFLLEQILFGVAIIAGLVLAIITFLLSVKHILRQVERWQQCGQTTKALAGLLALMLVAFIIALPIILALFFSIVT